MREFRLEHEFRAPSVAAVLEAYFDPDLQAEQDRAVDVLRREVVEHVDAPDELRRVCKVVPRRQLPAIVRPFIPGQLSFTELAVWRKPDDAIDLRVEPSLLGGRIEVIATYEVALVGPHRVHRTCAGHVSVELPLIGSRVERAVVDDMTRSVAATAAVTQAWLDRRILGR